MAEKFSTGLRNALLQSDSMKTIMQNGVIAIYSGTQPTDADAAEGAGSLLMLLTVNGGAFTPGVATNGLNLGVATNGVLAKDALEVWSGLGLAAAGVGTTATWFRYYDNNMVTGASTTARRIDGAIGTSTSYDMRMSNTTIVENGPSTVSTFTITIPAS